MARDPKRIEDRIKYVQIAMKDFPEIPEFCAEYAECLATQGKFEEAIPLMEKALKKYSNYKGLEPMLLTPKMVEGAKKRLELWRRKVNAKN